MSNGSLDDFHSTKGSYSHEDILQIRKIAKTLMEEDSIRIEEDTIQFQDYQFSRFSIDSSDITKILECLEKLETEFTLEQTNETTNPENPGYDYNYKPEVVTSEEDFNKIELPINQLNYKNYNDNTIYNNIFFNCNHFTNISEGGNVVKNQVSIIKQATELAKINNRLNPGLLTTSKPVYEQQIDIMQKKCTLYQRSQDDVYYTPRSLELGRRIVPRNFEVRRQFTVETERVRRGRPRSVFPSSGRISSEMTRNGMAQQYQIGRVPVSTVSQFRLANKGHFQNYQNDYYTQPERPMTAIPFQCYQNTPISFAQNVAFTQNNLISPVVQQNYGEPVQGHFVRAQTPYISQTSPYVYSQSSFAPVQSQGSHFVRPQTAMKPNFCFPLRRSRKRRYEQTEVQQPEVSSTGMYRQLNETPIVINDDSDLNNNVVKQMYFEKKSEADRLDNLTQDVMNTLETLYRKTSKEED